MSNSESYIIVVEGRQVELEIRECAGGCGRRFAVTKDSPNYFAFSDCAERCFNKNVSKHQHKKKFNPHHGRNDIKNWIVRRTENEESDCWNGW